MKTMRLMLVMCLLPWSLSSAAVVYETQFRVIPRINPLVFPGLIATAPGAVVPASGGVSPLGFDAGVGYFLVDGDVIQYFLRMNAYVAGQTALRFGADDGEWLVPLPTSQHFYSTEISCFTPTFDNPFLLGPPPRSCETSSYIDIVDEIGQVIERHAIYLSSPAVTERYLYSGQVTDPALASKLRDMPGTLSVGFEGDASLFPASLTLAGTPEPGRSMLVFVAAASLLMRRRRKNSL